MDVPKNPQPHQSPSKGYFISHTSRVKRKQQLSREEWMVLKPRIHELYIKQKKSFKYITNILKTREGFAPTKHQFTRKITEWGFRKNSRKLGRGQRMEVSQSPDRIEMSRSLTPVPMQTTAYKALSGTSPESEESNTKLLSLDELFRLLGVNRHSTPNITDIVRISHAPPNNLTVQRECISNDPLQVLCNNTRSDLLLLASQGGPVKRHTDTRPTLGFKWHNDVWFPTGMELLVPSPSNEVYIFPPAAKALFPQTKQSVPLATEYRLAEETFSNSLQRLQAVADIRHPAILSSKKKLARACALQGKFARAEELYRQILFEKDNTFSACESRSAHLHLILISMVFEQGRRLEALAMIDKVRDYFLRQFKPHEDIGIRFRWLRAQILGGIPERRREAESICRETLQIALMAFGPRDETTLNLLSLLGYSCFNRNQLKEKEEVCTAIIQIRKSTPGFSAEYWCEDLCLLSACLASQRRSQESIVLLKTALDEAVTWLGEDHPMTSQVHGQMGRVLRKQSLYGESEKHFRKRVEFQIKSLGNGHRSTLQTMLELGRTILNSGRTQEALTWYERNYEINHNSNKESSGKIIWSAFTLHCYTSLAKILQEEGNLQIAVTWYKRIFISHMDINEPLKAKALFSCVELGYWYEQQYQSDKALELYTRMEQSLLAAGPDGKKWLPWIRDCIRRVY